MKNISCSNRAESAGSVWSTFHSLLLAAALLLPAAAHADLLVASSGNPQYAQRQSCLVVCSQHLASCEHSQGRMAHCPRDFQSCKEGCEAPMPRPVLDRRASQQQLCEQRCELSASLCDQGAPLRPQHCIAGAAQCKDRCAR